MTRAGAGTGGESATLAELESELLEIFSIVD